MAKAILNPVERTIWGLSSYSRAFEKLHYQLFQLAFNKLRVLFNRIQMLLKLTEMVLTTTKEFGSSRRGGGERGQKETTLIFKPKCLPRFPPQAPARASLDLQHTITAQVAHSAMILFSFLSVFFLLVVLNSASQLRETLHTTKFS